MANFWEKVAGVSSIVLRLSAFTFLRWIPGHHFPPLIISALTVYLLIVLAKSSHFESAKVKLHALVPTLLAHTEVVDQDTGEEKQIEIEVYSEEPIFYEDEQAFLKILLCGIPDWREVQFSYITIGINILLAFLTLDLVFRGPLLYSGEDLRFTRVGFVDSTSAKILLREPDAQQLPIYSYFRPDDRPDWSEADKIYYVGSDTDYTRSLELTNLKPETTYTYRFSNELNGTFRTAPALGTPGANSLTFLTSSCIKANFPYQPLSHSLAIHGFRHLSNLVKSLPSTPAFMLFLGDFIYVDVPQRLSSTVSHYRSEYRRVYASPSWTLPGFKSLPWLHTLDDHEIANDWSGGNETSPFPEASDPFIHYHVSVNPPVPPQSQKWPDANTTYFQFTRGPASFFLLDTRRYRTNPESDAKLGKQHMVSKPLYGSSAHSSNPIPDPSAATMLGSAQLQDLMEFLTTPESPHVHWKIVASSVPFTKNWRFGTSDTWGGFLSERSRILDAMHYAERHLNVRIIILSGDRHEFAAIRFPPYITSASVADGNGGAHDSTPQSGPHEFSVGPLSMFYLPLRTFRQTDDEDVKIAYFPDGNSKVGVVEIENLIGGDASASREGKATGQTSLLKYSLWIDGVKTWEYILTSPAPLLNGDTS